MQPGKFAQILAVSALLAGYAAWLPGAHRQSPPVGPIGAEIPLIRLDRARELWQDPATLFVDVRWEVDYNFGHIPGAVNLPDADWDAQYPALADRLRRAKTIVVYCKSVDCGLSLWAAIRLRNEGLTQVVIYPRGWNEWFTAGLPVVRDPNAR